MSETNPSIQYTCTKCGYPNVWRRDELLQRGREVIYRGNDEAVYSLRCKNPVGCDERMRVAVKR
ncbi:hypothetical protein [Candidatus Viridilinea mediisalina]|uniref:Uncharacterized protein n=1 Tax=Candidatus Viridilinea mediisalina TaxID=2024553 RepID=A0A2A6RJF5_9CHLR|nr:hypothetical protein [Candidatus Viridilinea mediisalina]PDW03071.1 hypothetical protein CJ255_10825 [Candidatus Viridilinea mediisalina]